MSEENAVLDQPSMLGDQRYQPEIIPYRRSIDLPEIEDRAYEKIFRVMGVDLGQANDRSAATVLEKRIIIQSIKKQFIGPPDPYIRLKKIRRYNEGADYTLQADDLLAYPDLDCMVVEYNGVGRPVVDTLRRRAREIGYKGRIIALVTAMSSARLHESTDAKGTTISVPKINLVTSINLLMQRKVGEIDTLFRIEGMDRETKGNLKTLKQEMRDFQLRITKNANFVMGAEGPGKHDDLVMSLGLASWFMLNRQRPAAIYMP